MNKELPNTPSQLDNLVDLSNRENIEVSDEEDFRTFLDALPDSVCIVRGDQILFANQRFLEVFGYESRELTKSNPVIERIIGLLERLAKHPQPEGGGPVKTGEIRALTKTGSVVDLEVTCSKMESAEGVTLLAVLRDETERKQRYRRQRRLEMEILGRTKLSSIGILATGLTHHLNDPVTAIIGICQVLKLSHPEIEGLDRILEQTDQMSKIIDSLINKGRNDFNAEMKSLDLNELIASELDLLENDPKFQHKIQKELVFEENLPKIQGLYSDFSLSLVQFFLNAIEAMKGRRDKTLRIVTRSTEEMVYVEVSDTGKGISVRDLPRIFDPFFSIAGLQKKKTEKKKGIGFGLTLAKHLLSKYDAKIDAASKEGVGTTFIIGIPRDQKRKNEDQSEIESVLEYLH